MPTTTKQRPYPHEIERQLTVEHLAIIMLSTLILIYISKMFFCLYPRVEFNVYYHDCLLLFFQRLGSKWYYLRRAYSTGTAKRNEHEAVKWPSAASFRQWQRGVQQLLQRSGPRGSNTGDRRKLGGVGAQQVMQAAKPRAYRARGSPADAWQG